MCHYYRWSCPRCRIHQDCICRCHLGRVHAACTRTSKPSTLPDSAPPMACQRCGFVRGLHSPTPSFPLPSATPPAPCKPENPAPQHAATISLLLPPAHDPFSLRPIARLPDTAETLTRYETERMAIFVATQKANSPVSQLPRKDGESTSTNVGTLTCEKAWRRLEEAVCCRLGSEVIKREGGGG